MRNRVLYVLEDDHRHLQQPHCVAGDLRRHLRERKWYRNHTENIPLILLFEAVGAVDLQRYLRDSTCFRYLIKMIHPVLYFVAAEELRDIRRQI